MNKQKSKRSTKSKKLSKLGNKPVAQGATTAPIAKQKTVRTNAPKLRTTREGVIVTHREYIQDITRTTNTFTVDTIAVNAGLASAFPWLSQVAGRFESYTFERLDFIYEPMVPTTQAGSVMMAVDFDAADAAPANKTTIMSYKGATRSAPWQASRLVCSAIDRTKMVPERYVRTAALVGSYDIKTYDMGTLFVSTVGTGAATVNLGELYVEYTVRLRTPQIQTGASLALTRRTAQSGSLVMSQAGRLTSHLANIVGDATKPLAMIHPSDNLYFYINTATRLLITLWTRWGALGAQRNLSTIFQLANCGGQPIVEDANVSSSLINRIGRPSNLFQQTAGTSFSTAPREIVEQYVVSPNDGSLINGLQQRGVGNDWQVGFRGRADAITGTGNVTIDYTIIPLDNEGFPINNAGIPLQTGDGPITIDWPNLDPNTVLPAHRISTDEYNTFTFNNKTTSDALHPALVDPVKRR
jgi:hypothetical protein